MTMSSSRKKSMSKIYKWGLIGASRIAEEWLIPAINGDPNSEVAAVFSSDTARGHAYAERNGIPQIHDTIEALLRSDVDAVYISNTNEKHAPDAIAAILAGKHVLGEKPMAMTVAEAEAMIAAAETHNRVLGINHHLRNMATHIRLHDLVKNGELGTLVAARMTFGVLLPVANRGWRTDSVTAGAGVFFDLTVHDADLLHYILGTEAQEVVAMTANNGITSKEVEDTVAIVARMKTGTIVQITESFAIDHARTTVELFGTKASVFADDVLLQRGGGRVFVRRNGEKVEEQIDHVNAYDKVVSDFNAAMAGNGSPTVTGRDGLKSLKFAVAAREAARTGRSVQV
ncbi:Gfo/Idh/MocA family oxidoreductase [bacterium M00.F.Ca.ET.141.01.1.1]|nr:Gfo/Idh/MocA family oxidoreductase [Mesorhizobium sp. M8A.F.Ca.ET.165.01.1.1]TGV54098.1 Gfo/Idh/MocA family oxidoreductase [bacterium M00.F.Ca.ET.141.01.1.1]